MMASRVLLRAVFVAFTDVVGLQYGSSICGDHHIKFCWGSKDTKFVNWYDDFSCCPVQVDGIFRTGWPVGSYSRQSLLLSQVLWVFKGQKINMLVHLPHVYIVLAKMY